MTPKRRLFAACAAALAILFVPFPGFPSGIVPTAYNTIQNSGTPLTQRQVLNMTGAGVSCADSGGITVCTFSGGGGGGGSSINVLAAAGCRGNTVLTCTYNNIQSASDLCVVGVGWANGSNTNLPTATDTIGTSYSTIASFATANVDISSLALLGGTCGGTGANTVTLSPPSGFSFDGIYPMELVGVSSTTDGIGHGNLSSTPPNSNWNSIASIMTTATGDLILDLIDGQASNALGTNANNYMMNGGQCLGGFILQAATSTADSGAMCTLIQNAAGFIPNAAWNPSTGGVSVLMVALKHK